MNVQRREAVDLCAMAKQGVVIAAVAAVVAAVSTALYVLTRPPAVEVKKTAKTAGEPEAAKSATDLSLTREQLLAIFQEITARMQHVVMRLAEEEQRVSQQSGGAGQVHKQQEIQRYLMARFEEAMRDIETQVYSKFKTDEAAVREAVKYYEKDEDLIKTISTLKALYNAVMGQSQDLPAVPDHLTMDKLLDVLKGTMVVLRSCAEKIRDQLLKEGVDLKADPQGFTAKFQPKYARAVEAERAKLLKEHGIQKETELQAAVVKYQNNASFQTELKKLTDFHNQKMAELGFGSATA